MVVPGFEVRYEPRFDAERAAISPNVQMIDQVLDGAEWVACMRGITKATQIPGTSLYVIVADGKDFGDLLIFYTIQNHTISFQSIQKSPRA